MIPGKLRQRSGLATILLLGLFALAGVATGTAAENSQDQLQVIDITDPASGDISIEQFKWQKRLLIILADSPFDPRFVEQLAYLDGEEHFLTERDVVVLRDTDPAAKSELRRKFRPRDFVIILVAKDGTVFLRKPTAWSVREFSNAIDKLPIRQQEIKSR